MADSGIGASGRQDKGLVIKTEEFSNFLFQMKRTLADKTTMQKLTDYEVGRVLNRALQLTGNADRQKIRERVKNRSKFTFGDKTYWIRQPGGGKDWRVPNAVWGAIKAMRAASLQRKLGAVGITKKSWLILAEKLGQTITAPAFVRRAQVSNPGFDGNTKVERTGSGDRYGVRITNRTPTLGYPGTEGAQAFFAALQGRIGFFHKNVSKGVFDSVKRLSAKYKGIIVQDK